MSDFTNRIDAALVRNNQTRAEMFREINLAKSGFNKWIEGSNPSVETAYKISKFLGVSLEYLIAGEESPDPVSLLSFQEQKLLEVFRNLNQNDQNAVLTLANGLMAQYSSTTQKNISIG